MTTDRNYKIAVVDWAVSKNKRFTKVVSRGSTFTSSDVDFTVKVRSYSS